MPYETFAPNGRRYMNSPKAPVQWSHMFVQQHLQGLQQFSHEVHELPPHEPHELLAGPPIAAAPLAGAVPGNVGAGGTAGGVGSAAGGTTEAGALPSAAT